MSTLAARFEQKYIPEPNSGCWIWTGTGTQDGYGHIREGKQTLRAHRVSYEMYRGLIPSGFHVLHHCDTPSCVNPDHLFLGDDAANSRDMMAKGRHKAHIGSEHGRAKLTESDVLNIRASPLNHKDAALCWGVTDTLIRLIRQRKIWRHV